MSGCVPCQAFVQDLKLTIREIKSYKSESLDRHAAAAIRRVVLQKYEAALKRSKVARQRSRLLGRICLPNRETSLKNKSCSSCNEVPRSAFHG